MKENTAKKFEKTNIPVDDKDDDESSEEGGVVKFKKVKSYGLVWPWHFQQVATWILTTILVLSFYLFLIPGNYYIHKAYIIILSLLYVCFSSVTLRPHNLLLLHNIRHLLWSFAL